MKTAISLPEQTYQRATRRARELGISRSEFFATAAERYLDTLDAALLTEQIDRAVDAAGNGDPAVISAGRGRLSQQRW